ncbi:NAD(P)-dependent alcohol dehydrogenase [Streptomyces tendae]
MVEISAAVVRENRGPFTVEHGLILDEPRPDEVLVRMVGVGVCHSDIYENQVGPTPAVHGHEGAGVVVRVGSAVTRFTEGDRVLMSFASCGSCRNCLEGRPAYCEKFMTLNLSGARADGSRPIKDATGLPVFSNFFGQSSFADHALAAERNLVKVPDSVPDDLFRILGPLGCGIQTGAGAVLNTFNPNAGSTILVAGAGGVGLSAVLGAQVASATKIVALDVVPSRLELATELGATHTVDGKDPDVVARLREIAPGGFDYALETTGNAQVLRTLVETTRVGGQVGLIGAGKPGSEVTLKHSSLLSGPILRGIFEGDSVPQEFIPRLIDLYQAGRFPFDKLVTTYPFEQIQRAVDDSEAGTTVKAVLTF